MDGHISLKQQFPDQYILCLQQQATVAEMWTGQGWDLNFRRNLNDWEVGRVAGFLKILACFANLSAEKDQMVWKEGTGLFSVNSAYKDLNRSNFKEVHWPWKKIWKTKIPYKVNCFTWLLAKESVLTHDNFNK